MLRRLIVAVMLVVSGAAGAQSGKPVIAKIDPPNWFVGLPDSMLLVHGEHLENTTFSVKGGTAKITEATNSANGHWAFLTFVTARAKVGTVEIVATNRHGSSSAAYALSARRSRAEQPKGFGSQDVMYLIMPDRFADGDAANDGLKGFRDPDDRSAGRAYHGGDLRGIQEHLDYLQELGVTTIWTTPLYDNSAQSSGQTYHGYSATDMYAVDPHLGSMEDYRALVVAAHKRGMKVVLDTVPNHVGPGHPWVKDEPTPDWFHGTADAHVKVEGDFGAITDVKATAARRHVLLDGWFADILPDMNQNNPLVAQYLLQNAIWWIEEAGLDGLRIDTFPYVPRSFWHDYNEQLHALYPELKDVGEVFDKDARTTSFFAGGVARTGSDGTVDTQLDTPFDFPMYFALRGALTHHAPMSAVADVLAMDSLYPHSERLVTFLGNHDTMRFLNEPGANVAALKIGFGLLATMRGMPQLYYGDEIGMTGGDDPYNRKDFPGGWRKDTVNAFTAAGRSDAQKDVHDWVETVMRLRLHAPVLESGKQQTLLADKGTFAFVRAKDLAADCKVAPGAERLVVVVNNEMSAKDVVVPMEGKAIAGCGTFSTVLGSAADAHVEGGGLRVRLGAQKLIIVHAAP